MTTSPSTRASLLLRLRDHRDNEAWVEFVTLYEPIIYRLFRTYRVQDADIRELMQDLFLAVSRNIDRFDGTRPGATFRGWLRRVTRNLFINWAKHRERSGQPKGGTGWQDLLGQVPDEHGPASVDFDNEVRQVIFERAADQVRNEVLPATWTAFWETSVTGLSPTEVAARLGVSVGAIRVAKCRVLARLQAVVRTLEVTND